MFKNTDLWKIFSRNVSFVWEMGTKPKCCIHICIYIFFNPFRCMGVHQVLRQDQISCSRRGSSPHASRQFWRTSRALWGLRWLTNTIFNTSQVTMNMPPTQSPSSAAKLLWHYLKRRVKLYLLIWDSFHQCADRHLDFSSSQAFLELLVDAELSCFIHEASLIFFHLQLKSWCSPV